MDIIDKKEIAFHNLKHLKNISLENIKDIELKKENIKSIHDLKKYIVFNVTFSDFINHSYDDHNLLNKTYGKKNVPTIYQDGNIFNNIIYCPHCGKMHKEVDYAGEILIKKQVFDYRARIQKIDSITCLKCNTRYFIDDMKILNGRFEYINGEVFIDEDKISLSYIYMWNSINKHGNFYYEDGKVKLTLNTKTGYSYTTNKGHAYKELKRLWERYDKVPPIVFNSTYTFSDGTSNIINAIINCKEINRYKAMDKKDLLIEFSKRNRDYYDTKRKKEKELASYIANELYNKVQQNFNYKLPEHIKKAGNNDYVRTFKNFNRYVNINPNSSILNILIDKEHDLKKNKIDREEVNLINKLFKLEKIKLGKKTRAIVQQELYNKKLFNALPILLCFKNTSNINKLINEIKENDMVYDHYSYDSKYTAEAIKLWLNYRDENYIAARYIENLHMKIQKTCVEPTHVYQKSTSKLKYMRDSCHMINQIKQYIEDFDIKEFINFKNEKQFHDDLSRFMNSEEYHDLVEKKQASIVFKLEKDIFDLEDKNNNIIIARNNRELQKIGRQMNICVGGYTGLVEKGNCRIVYIMDNENKEYKACLELRGYTNKNKTEYSLVQAKLKYNRRPCEDMDIYNKILKWTDDNKIKVDTYDMELPQEKLKDVIRAI